MLMTQFDDWLALVADKFRWSTSESSLDVCSLRQVNEKPFEDVKHCMSSLTKGNCSCCMFLLLVPIISPLYSTVNFWDWENGGEPDICKVGAINMFLWAVDKRGFQHVSGLNLPLSEQYHSFTIASQKSTLVLKGTGTGQSHHFPHTTALPLPGVVKFAQVVGVFPGPRFDDAEGAEAGEADVELLGWEAGSSGGDVLLGNLIFHSSWRHGLLVLRCHGLKVIADFQSVQVGKNRSWSSTSISKLSRIWIIHAA